MNLNPPNNPTHNGDQDAYFAVVRLDTSNNTYEVRQILYYIDASRNLLKDIILRRDNQGNPLYLYAIILTPPYTNTFLRFSFATDGTLDTSNVVQRIIATSGGNFRLFELALDQNGNLFAAGYCSGTSCDSTIIFDQNGPGNVPDPYQSTYNGGDEGYIIKLDENLNPIISTYLGGTSREKVEDIVIDRGGRVIVAGQTNQQFPVQSSPPPMDDCNNTPSDYDPFITILNNDLSQMIYSSCLRLTQGLPASFDGKANISSGYWGSGRAVSVMPFYDSNNQLTDLMLFVNAVLHYYSYPNSFYYGIGRLYAIKPDLSQINAYADLWDPNTQNPQGGYDRFLYFPTKLKRDPQGKLWLGWGVHVFPPTEAGLFFSPHSFKPRNNKNQAVIERWSYDPATKQFTRERATQLGSEDPQDPSWNMEEVHDLDFIPSSGQNPMVIVGGSIHGISGTTSLIRTQINDQYPFPTTQGAFLSSPQQVSGYARELIEGFVAILDYNLFDPSTGPVIDSLSVSSNNIQVGQTATISWQITHTEADSINCDIDIDGDGTPEYTNIDCLNITSQDHTFTQNGTFDILLIVNDPVFESLGGQKVSQSVRITVNAPPQINSFSADPNPVQLGNAVTLSWNVSDPDGDSLTCLVDVDNDGTPEQTINSCTSASTYNHTYQSSGTYTAKLTVDDGKGANSEQTIQVTVNAPPQINSFSADPSSGIAPLTVTFSWQIQDADGDQLTCKIDIDGDGQFDYTITACTSSSTQDHTYQNPNTYTVKLRIEDSKGGYAEKTLTVTVNKSSGGTGGTGGGGAGGGGGGNCSVVGSSSIYSLLILLVIAIRRFKGESGRLFKSPS